MSDYDKVKLAENELVAVAVKCWKAAPVKDYDKRYVMLDADGTFIDVTGCVFDMRELVNTRHGVGVRVYNKDNAIVVCDRRP
jgi:hypothetical protein